jgi:hypothetical protein
VKERCQNLRGPIRTPRTDVGPVGRVDPLRRAVSQSQVERERLADGMERTTPVDRTGVDGRSAAATTVERAKGGAAVDARCLLRACW